MRDAVRHVTESIARDRRKSLVDWVRSYISRPVEISEVCSVTFPPLQPDVAASHRPIEPREPGSRRVETSPYEQSPRP